MHSEGEINTLITGASGKIGGTIVDSLDGHLFTPSHAEMPVESAWAVSKYIAALPSLDLVICAHGLFGEASRVENSDPWQWRYALEVNLLGTYNVIRFALGKMADGGSIITIAGGGGMLDPLPFISSYACSKSGIVSLTKTVAAEHPELRVNCIFPGMQDSEIHDRLLAAGPEGNPAYHHIKKMRDTGEGAVPTWKTITAIEYLLAGKESGQVLFARRF